MRLSAGVPFIGIGIAFFVIGLTSRGTFLWIGVAFLVIGFIALARGRKSPGAS